MNRLLVVAFLVVIGVGVGVHRWYSVSPEARVARPFASKLARQLQHDSRFKTIEVGVWELGSKGPMYVRGVLGSDSDAAELHRILDSLHCPVGISWQVAVNTNQLKVER